MFTGLIEEIGTVEELVPLGDAVRIAVRAPKVTQDAVAGDSQGLVHADTRGVPGSGVTLPHVAGVGNVSFVHVGLTARQEPGIEALDADTEW